MSRYDDEWDLPEREYASDRRSAYPISERPSRRGTARLPQEKLVAIARARNEALRPQEGRDRPRKGRERGRGQEPITRKLLPFIRRGNPVIEPDYTFYPARPGNRGYRYVPAIRPDEPLLDIRSAVRTVYDSRRLIGLLMMLGMVCGGSATLLVSREYTARSSLYFDPVQVQFNWDSQSQNAVTPQSATANHQQPDPDSHLQCGASGCGIKTVARERSGVCGRRCRNRRTLRCRFGAEKGRVDKS